MHKIPVEIFNSRSKNNSGFNENLSSIDKVDSAMLQMDALFNTQFHAWIKNENNVDYTSYYLRKIINEYEDDRFDSIVNAIKWLVSGWSVQRTAELLIKLFYHWGIGNNKFANLVSEITKEWQVQTQVVDLVVTLVIGERSSKTARFIKFVAKEWNDTKKVIDLVTLVSSRLRWTERYFKHFILQYICLDNSLWEQKKVLVSYIREQYYNRKNYMQQNIPETQNTSYSKGFDFSISLFVEIVMRLESSIYNQQNSTDNSIPNSEWEWQLASLHNNSQGSFCKNAIPITSSQNALSVDLNGSTGSANQLQINNDENENTNAPDISQSGYMYN